MAEQGDRKSSVSHPLANEDEDSLKDPDSKPSARSPKKKKVRRHRAPKSGNLSRLEEETDEEGERKNLSSRERKQVNVEGLDLDDIPTLNYVSDDKKPPVVIPDEPEELEEEDVVPVPEEEEEEEVEEEEPCMTAEEKQAMYSAAAVGDIDLLEDCLDKPNSDINMVWFQENLLMAALKGEQEEMAEFLIDNGVNYNFKTTIISVKDERTRFIEWYERSCRQIAFDRGMHDIVELIDYLNGDLFPFIKPKQRIPRYRRPKPPTPEPATGGESENDASSEASKDRSDDEGDGRMKRKRKKKRKDSKDEEVEKSKDDEEKKEDMMREKEKSVKISEDVTDTYDADSGHHSCESIGDNEKCEDGKLDNEDSAGRSKSRTSSKGRTGSSRCSTRLTSVTGTSSPLLPRSETFMRKFMFLNCPSDEGYGSLSSKSSPTSAEIKQKKSKIVITIPPRGTKSSLGMRQASLYRKALAEQDDDLPLKEKKIKIPGSYEFESSKWYGSSFRKSIDKRRNPGINDEPKALNVNVSKNVPKRQDAHYMQMTASAYTKRKLEPNFRKAYSSLDFVDNRLMRSSQSSFSRKSMSPRQTVNFSRPSVKKSKEHISVNFRSYNSERWKSTSQNSRTSQYYRPVTRVH